MRSFICLLAAVLFLVLWSCTKLDEEVQPEEIAVANRVNSSGDSLAVARVKGCAPDYGDSIICDLYLGKGKDRVIQPVNFPGKAKGLYFSKPQGLSINTQTGAINIDQSESGMTYVVGFVGNGTRDTCVSKLTISGITYMHGVHILSDNDTSVMPQYLGKTAMDPIIPIGLFGNTDYDLSETNYSKSKHAHKEDKDKKDKDKKDKDKKDKNKDDTDDDNDDDDRPPFGHVTCNDKKIRVDTTFGMIDLKQSVRDGLFGRTPVNGITVEGLMYYRLSDCSNRSLRKIRIRLTYYNRLADVPKNVFNEVRNADLAVQARYDTWAPRPPHIIVVANR